MLARLIAASLLVAGLRAEESCAISATFPADGSSSPVELANKARYEVRECPGPQEGIREIHILAFEQRVASPRLSVKTGAQRLGLTLHIGNVLIVEALPGVSSSQLYVLRFLNGVPAVLASEQIAGIVSYKSNGDVITLTVQLKTYAGEAPKFKTHRVRIE